MKTTKRRPAVRDGASRVDKGQTGIDTGSVSGSERVGGRTNL
jgi:hypothetical protein